MIKILKGDCRKTLSQLDSWSVQTCVTSPPYWGLRSYLPKDHPDKKLEIGQEKTPEEYVATMVGVFNEVKRVLRDDGTLWLNLGDSYASGGNGGHTMDGENFHGHSAHDGEQIGRRKKPPVGLKAKDLVGIPWRVAFALQRAGWYLRQEIIWAKPNPMPESVTDRCTKSHEHIFLLAKSARYYYNHEAIKEPASDSFSNDSRWETGPTEANDKNGYELNGAQNPKAPHSVFLKGRTGQNAFRGQGHQREGNGPANRDGREMREIGAGLMVNKRDVWTVTTKPFKEAHFATFPTELITPCILAVSRPGDLVLDPFGGSGTTAQVAIHHGRKAAVCELNDDYIPLIQQRTNITPGLNLP